MVLFLNALPTLLFLLAIACLAKATLTLSPRWGFVAVGFMLIGLSVMFLTPSAMPKGTVKRFDSPPLKQTEAQVEDLLRKPSMTEQERTEHLDSKLDAVEQAKEKSDGK